jgi:hypothetical protein
MVLLLGEHIEDDLSIELEDTRDTVPSNRGFNIFFKNGWISNIRHYYS